MLLSEKKPIEKGGSLDGMNSQEGRTQRMESVTEFGVGSDQFNFFAVVPRLVGFTSLTVLQQSFYRLTLRPKVVIFVLKGNQKRSSSLRFLVGNLFANFLERFDFFVLETENPRSFFSDRANGFRSLPATTPAFLLGFLVGEAAYVHAASLTQTDIEPLLIKYADIPAQEIDLVKVALKVIPPQIRFASPQNTARRLSPFQILLVEKLNQHLYNPLELSEYCLLKLMVLHNDHVVDKIKQKFSKHLQVTKFGKLFTSAYTKLKHKNYPFERRDFEGLMAEFSARKIYKPERMRELVDQFREKLDKRGGGWISRSRHSDDQFEKNAKLVVQLCRNFLNSDIKSEDFAHQLIDMLQTAIDSKSTDNNSEKSFSVEENEKFSNPMVTRTVTNRDLRRFSRISEPTFVRLSSKKSATIGGALANHSGKQKSKIQDAFLNMPETLSDEDSQLMSQVSEKGVMSTAGQWGVNIPNHIVQRARKATRFSNRELSPLHIHIEDHDLGESSCVNPFTQENVPVPSVDYRSATFGDGVMEGTDSNRTGTSQQISKQLRELLGAILPRLPKWQQEIVSQLENQRNENLEAIFELYLDTKDFDDFLENLCHLIDLVSKSRAMSVASDTEKPFSFKQPKANTNSIYSFKERSEEERTSNPLQLNRGSKKVVSRPFVPENTESSQISEENTGQLSLKSSEESSVAEPPPPEARQSISESEASQRSRSQDHPVNALGVNVMRVRDLVKRMSTIRVEPINSPRSPTIHGSSFTETINMSSYRRPSDGFYRVDSTLPPNPSRFSAENLSRIDGARGSAMTSDSHFFSIPPKRLELDESSCSNSVSYQSISRKMGLNFNGGFADNGAYSQRLISLKKIRHSTSDADTSVHFRNSFAESRKVSAEVEERVLNHVYRATEKMLSNYFAANAQKLLEYYDNNYTAKRGSEVKKPDSQRSLASPSVPRPPRVLEMFPDVDSFRKTLQVALKSKSLGLLGPIIHFIFGPTLLPQYPQGARFHQVVLALNQINIKGLEARISSRDFVIAFEKEVLAFLESTKSINGSQLGLFNNLAICDEPLLISFIQVLLLTNDIRDFIDSLYTYTEQHGETIKSDMRAYATGGSSSHLSAGNEDVSKRLQGLLIHVKNPKDKAKVIALDKDQNPEFLQTVMQYDLSNGYRGLAEKVLEIIRRQTSIAEEAKKAKAEAKPPTTEEKLAEIWRLLETIPPGHKSEIKNMDVILQALDQNDAYGLTGPLLAAWEVFNETEDKGDFLENVLVCSMVVSEKMHASDIAQLKKLLVENHVPWELREEIINETFLVNTSRSAKLESYFQYLLQVEDFDDYLESVKVVLKIKLVD